MPNSAIQTAVRQLRRAVLRQDGAGKPDAELLGSFLDHNDEAAFEALVRRHGAMVLGVCRRVLRDHHDAEDAFQATFLVLARKADSVRPREGLAGWLHGVAYRTALKARAAALRRRAREKQLARMPEPAAPPQDPWHDLKPLLDQEVSRLPEPYRLPVLFCALGGKSIREAARQLGWPQGTVAGRLARGRKLLARRLARRGLVFSGGTLAALLAQGPASAGVPAPLMSSTVKVASSLAAGRAVTAGLIPARVAALTERVVTGMMLTKLKAGTAALLVLGLFALGGGLLSRPTAARPIKAEGPSAENRNGGEAEKPAAPQKSPGARKGRGKQAPGRASGPSPVGPSYVVGPPDVLLVEVAGLPKGPRLVEWECVVRPDGTISLGAYGSVPVAGRSLARVREAIRDHLAPHADKGAWVEVEVNLLAYNSKAFYLIARGEGGEQVYRFPATGGETVAGAVLRVNGLARKALKGGVWLAGPSGEALDVDWRAITRRAESGTNYLLRPGDRVYVGGPPPK